MSTIDRSTVNRCNGRWYLEILFRQKKSQKIGVGTEGVMSKGLRQRMISERGSNAHGGKDRQLAKKHPGQQQTLRDHDVTLEEIQTSSGSKFGGQGGTQKL